MISLKTKIACLLAPGILWGGVVTDVWSAPAPSQGQDTKGEATPAPAPSILYGNIRSVKDQKALSGVPIMIENTTTGLLIKKTSDSQGAFIFSNLPPGDYKVRVGGGTFSVQQKEGILKAGTVGEMDF
ncbi:MAG: carboxypeptidase-like regulatory domain-containing protein, partial [Nitrospiraceae bacterium]|nr:carboxypeptidase-like regulatory domain-containing protein [Nitrospiraceae bacterium]